MTSRPGSPRARTGRARSRDSSRKTSRHRLEERRREPGGLLCRARSRASRRRSGRTSHAALASRRSTFATSSGEPLRRSSRTCARTPFACAASERVREQRRRALVDRRGAHLHGGRGADLGADDDALDTVERERGNLVGALSGEVDARRPGFHGGGPEIDPSTRSQPARRRSSRAARLVSGAIAFRSTTSGCARSRSRSRARSSATHSAASGGTIESTTSASRRPRRGRATARAALARRADAVRALRPASGRDDARAAARERVRDRAPHRSRADDADGLHARRVYEDSRTERHLRARGSRSSDRADVRVAEVRALAASSRGEQRKRVHAIPLVRDRAELPHAEGRAVRPVARPGVEEHVAARRASPRPSPRARSRCATWRRAGSRSRSPQRCRMTKPRPSLDAERARLRSRPAGSAARARGSRAARARRRARCRTT